jgi:2'-5' RNA ligase
MPYAAELELDAGAARVAVEAMQHLERTSGLETPRALGVPPHLSLAVWETVEPAELRPRLDAIARELTPPLLRLGSLGLFGGASAVLFLAPVPSAELLDFHAAFHRAFADLDPQCWPYYRPGRWVPHVTLAAGLDASAVGTAAAAVAPGWSPIEAQVAALGLIRFRPVELLHRVPFERGTAATG